MDPFAGTGRTGIVGAMRGYNSVLVEIEPLFKQGIERNISFCQRKFGVKYNPETLGEDTFAPLFNEHITCTLPEKNEKWKGDCEVILGDARSIPQVPNNSIDAIITSPPYATQIHNKSTDATRKALNKTGKEPCWTAVQTGYGTSRTFATGPSFQEKSANKSSNFRANSMICIRFWHVVQTHPLSPLKGPVIIRVHGVISASTSTA